MSDPVAIRVQDLDQASQVVALSRLAAHLPDGSFLPADVLRVYDDLALPKPSNIHAVLGRLRGKELTQGADGSYRLTPKGRLRSLEILDDLDAAALAAEAQAVGSAELAHASTVVLPPYLAPPELLEPLRAFLAEHPFDTNVFGMTRFPDEADEGNDPDPVAGALEAVEDACKGHGLDFHLASYRQLHDDLWPNVAGYMWASRYGVALFEDLRGKGINYNLTIEVGGMLMAGRRCAILKDESIDALPTDLVGKIYKSVDLSDTQTTADTIHRWIRDDLNIDACDSCPTD